MSTYYRKNILQAASTSNAPDTDTSSSSMSSNLTVESTLSVSPDESRPATVGGDRQPLLEAVGNGGANGQQPKPRSNNTEVHVYVYKNCLDCAETDGKKIIEAVELATLGSSQSGDVGSGGGGGGSGGGGGGGGSGGSDGTGPAVVLKVAPLLRGRPGTDKAKAKKVAQLNQQQGGMVSRPITGGNGPNVAQPGMDDVNDGIQVDAETDVLEDKDDKDSCIIKCLVYTMECCSIM